MIVYPYTRHGMIRQLPSSSSILINKYKHHHHRHYNSNTTIYNTMTMTTTNTENNEKYCKRKMALVISYVGANYLGIQMDLNAMHLPTIEKELELALYKIGCIASSNHPILSKIQWSRSSRYYHHYHCYHHHYHCHYHHY